MSIDKNEAYRANEERTMSRALKIKSASKWSFDSSSTAGLSLGLLSAGGGFIDLVAPPPPDDQNVRMTFGMIGAGKGYTFKIPLMIGGSIAGSLMPSAGKIYIFDSFSGDELTRSDISGLCCAMDASSGAFFLGVSGTIMLVGIKFVKVLGDRLLWVSYPTIAILKGELDLLFGDDDPLYISPNALIVMGGLNVGTIGGNANGYLGYLA